MTTLQQRIRDFYDTSSALWENAWGEHMHHGYYGRDGRRQVNHYQAQIDLIEELRTWGGVDGFESMLDAGCGIGGSTTYLVERYGGRGAGITLSPRQADRARERAEALGLGERCDFRTADAMNPPFSEESFDLLWSLESGEHMPDKGGFVAACRRMLRPGGRLLMATWCHRPAPEGLTADEEAFLDDLCDAYHLPYLISIEEYRRLAEEAGFADVRIDDWTAAVAPFWKAVVKSAFQPSNMLGVMRAGWPTIRGALAMKYMIQGYRSGLVRFGVLSGVRR